MESFPDNWFACGYGSSEKEARSSYLAVAKRDEMRPSSNCKNDWIAAQHDAI